MTDTWESTPFIEEVWESQATGITWATVFRDGGAGGGGAVDSVNGRTGVVVLDATDVGALPDDTVIPDITGLQATSEKNQPNGYAGLDGDGTVPDNRIPSSIARDTEIGTQITAHDGSGTAHPDIRAAVDAAVPVSAIDTDSTLAADSDTRVPSQKAVKAHVATKADVSHAHSGADITSGLVAPAVLGTGGAGAGAKFLADDQTFKAPPSLGAVLGDVKMTSAQASVSFTSIPSTYASLVVVYQVRGDSAGSTNTGIRMTLNNDSGSNYNGEFVGGNNTTAYAAIQTAAAFGYLGEMPAATATAGYASSGTIEIPNYVGTTFFKNALFATTRDTNGAGANMVAYRGHIVWKSTTAISRLDLFPQFGNFLAGSRVTLYGIVGA